MQWIFVLCGCMFRLSLIATYQVCTVSLKAGLYTYNRRAGDGLQPPLRCATLQLPGAPDARRSAPEAWGKNPRRNTRHKSVLGHTASCNTCHDGAGRPPRRQNRRQPILDDTLPENTAGVVLDHTRSSLQAVERCLATPSRRVPSHAILDDLVSHKLSRREARWHRASKPPLSQVLDSLFRASSMAERLGARHQHRTRPCWTTSCRQGHLRTVLGDHMPYAHGSGGCLTTGGRRVLLSGGSMALRRQRIALPMLDD